MKKLIVAAAIAMATSTASAWEHAQNPDRFPSFGITYSGQAEEGDYKLLGASQDVESTTRSLILDTRLPLSSSFTLSLGLGSTGENYKGKENASFNADELDTKGGVFFISGRYYFNR